jgi:hypothetical protein
MIYRGPGVQRPNDRSHCDESWILDRRTRIGLELRGYYVVSGLSERVIWS